MDTHALEYHGNFAEQSVAFAYASATTYTYPVLHEQEYTHDSKSNDISVISSACRRIEERGRCKLLYCYDT